MEIRTSYYANLKSIDKTKYYPIAISRYLPKNINLTQILELAPPSWLIKEKNQGKFIEEFQKRLECLDSMEVYELLKSISKEKVPVLLCYEKPGEFCHRHIIAEWFEKAGIRVKELGYEDYERVNYRIIENKIQTLWDNQ